MPDPVEPISSDEISPFPSVPNDFEQVVLTNGPRILRWLVQECGGVGKASSLAKVATPTVSRWISATPGSVFGSPREFKSYRSIWVGYPSPFPGMDRVVEELIGPDESYIGALVARYGWARTWRFLRSKRGFGLDLLDFEDYEIAEVCNSIGIPRTTRTRWWQGNPYPSQWRAIDRISKEVVGKGWIETLLSSDFPVRRAIPKAALVVIVDEIRHGKLIVMDTAVSAD